MSLLAGTGLVALGIVLLAGGGELLVRGAVSIARLARLTTAVIGLTVVALGTSMPEMAVSLLAASRGQPDLAVGNVVGSNSFNIGAIVGLCALFIPLRVSRISIRLDWPFMFASGLLLLLLARDGSLGRGDGAVFVLALVAFVAYALRLARREVVNGEAASPGAREAGGGRRGTRGTLALDLTFLIGGVTLLVVGARLLVEGAVVIAQAAGLSERVIGLTIVAAGTSAPELATSLVAAWRKHQDIALANVIGSNIFNVLGILGVVALVSPIRVQPRFETSDIPWMLGFSLLLYLVMVRRSRIGRRGGALILVAYGTYLALLLR